MQKGTILGNNILDSSNGQGVESIFTPFRLVSLLEMIPISRKLILMVDQLSFLTIMDNSRFLAPPDNIRSLPNENNSLNAIEIEKGKNILNWLERELLTDLKLKESPKKLIAIKQKLSGSELIPIREHQQDIRELQNRISDELDDILFGFIPVEKAKYYRNPEFFDIEVLIRFPSAVKDMREAGTCYAHELHTACVFHLMRVVEVGAKEMVREMKAQKHIGSYKSISANKTFVKKPIELCDWKTLIDGLNKALKELENGTGASIKKKAKLAYFSHAVAQFSNFKDAWRNIISHGHEIEPNRKLYLEGETTDIMNNTRYFMQHLAKRIKENEV